LKDVSSDIYFLLISVSVVKLQASGIVLTASVSQYCDGETASSYEPNCPLCYGHTCGTPGEIVENRSLLAVMEALYNYPMLT
jgi:hypothetical protein